MQSTRNITPKYLPFIHYFTLLLNLKLSNILKKAKTEKLIHF